MFSAELPSTPTPTRRQNLTWALRFPGQTLITSRPRTALEQSITAKKALCPRYEFTADINGHDTCSRQKSRRRFLMAYIENEKYVKTGPRTGCGSNLTLTAN
jgi:hypothetical protein